MRDIVLTRDLPYPPQAVWAALTDSEQLAVWLMKNTFRPEVGHEFTFTTQPAPGFDGTVHCRVLAMRPQQHLQISWRGGPLNTVLSYDLEAIPTGTRLTLKHTGFNGVNNLLARLFLSLGWKKNLDVRLRAALDTRRTGR
jgi:uncharacterized protein YndB with AHSA1/START domain